MIPLDYISNKEINRIIRQITSYTGGVYYFHFKVRDFLNNKFIIVKSETLLGCFLNYIICYILCFFGIKVFGKTKLKYLFTVNQKKFLFLINNKKINISIIKDIKILIN